MTSSSLLLADDQCRRMVYFLQRWEVPYLTPKDILSRSIEFGLMAEVPDPGLAAADFAMQLATEQTIDTAETDLLGIACHVSSLADFLTWLLRSSGDPWVRPEPKDGWVPSCFLSADERSLRSVALVSRFDGLTEMELRTAWAGAGECAVYGVPMDVVVVEVGSLRLGRWMNPFTSAWRHPVAKTLRFRKRDGESFGSAWERVWREHDDATREEWLDAMTEDGVLAEHLHVLHIDVPELGMDILSKRKLERIRSTTEPPERQPSRCYDKVRPCPFRGECPKQP